MSNYALLPNGKRIRKYLWGEVEGEEVVQPTKEWVEFQEKVFFEKKLLFAGIPPESVRYGFEGYIGPDRDGNIERLVEQYIPKFKDKYNSTSLYFWGEKNSTQKTTVASLVGAELLRKEFSVKMILMGDLVRSLLKQGFDESIESLISECYEVDLLIIDDAFDSEKVTLYKSGYQISFIDEFLRKRIERFNRATIFTANLPIEDIGKKFSRHIQALLERRVASMKFEDSVSLKDDFNPNDIWN